jgi:hypothetical protein
VPKKKQLAKRKRKTAKTKKRTATKPTSSGKQRNKKGQFVNGHVKLGGRGPGVPDGIRLLRKLIGETAAEMVDAGEFKRTFDAMRKKGDAGVVWMLKHVFEDMLKKLEEEEAPPYRHEIVVMNGRTDD